MLTITALQSQIGSALVPLQLPDRTDVPSTSSTAVNETSDGGGALTSIHELTIECDPYPGPVNASSFEDIVQQIPDSKRLVLDWSQSDFLQTPARYMSCKMCLWLQAR